VEKIFYTCHGLMWIIVKSRFYSLLKKKKKTTELVTPKEKKKFTMHIAVTLLSLQPKIHRLDFRDILVISLCFLAIFMFFLSGLVI
jgi:hypothetical protein